MYEEKTFKHPHNFSICMFTDLAHKSKLLQLVMGKYLLVERHSCRHMVLHIFNWHVTFILIEDALWLKKLFALVTVFVLNIIVS